MGPDTKCQTGGELAAAGPTPNSLLKVLVIMRVREELHMAIQRPRDQLHR